jgi:hypothetical protein
MAAEQALLLRLARDYGPAFFAEQPFAPALGWRAPPHYHLMSLEDLRSGPYRTDLASLATPENLKPFRFLLSAKDELRYPGFERYDLIRVGLRPDLLRLPTGADRRARYIHLRPVEAPVMLSRLSAAVSQHRTGGAQAVREARSRSDSAAGDQSNAPAAP